MKLFPSLSLIRMGTICILLCNFLVTLGTFVACDDDEAILTDDKPLVTLITDYIGTDDQGYQSLVYQTAAQWEKREDINVNILLPKSKKTAEEMFTKWPEQTRELSKALLIVASHNYQEMLDQHRLELNENQQVIAFEGKAPHQSQGFSTFTFNRNGAAYLAGKMASKCKDIVVIAGEGQPYINKAWQAFQQGLEGQHTFNVTYLAFDNEGFNRPDSAYHATAQHPDAFLFPLAGKSNLGVYRYLQECEWPHQLMAAGMDVDCNARSERIPFSIVLHVDRLMNHYLQLWLDGQPLPLHKTWGMASGMVEVVLNSAFTQQLDVKPADYENFYQKYKAEAIEKENSFAPGVN